MSNNLKIQDLDKYALTPDSSIKHRVWNVLKVDAWVSTKDIEAALSDTPYCNISGDITKLRRAGVAILDEARRHEKVKWYKRVANPAHPHTPQADLQARSNMIRADMIKPKPPKTPKAFRTTPKHLGDALNRASKRDAVHGTVDRIKQDIEILAELCTKVNLAEVGTADLLAEIGRRMK